MDFKTCGLSAGEGHWSVGGTWEISWVIEDGRSTHPKRTWKLKYLKRRFSLDIIMFRFPSFGHENLMNFPLNLTSTISNDHVKGPKVWCILLVENIFFGGDQTVSSDPSMQHSPREISPFVHLRNVSPDIFCPHGKGQTLNRFNGNGRQLYFWSRCMFQSGFQQDPKRSDRFLEVFL